MSTLLEDPDFYCNSTLEEEQIGNDNSSKGWFVNVMSKYKENVTHQHEGVDGGFVVDGGMTLMTVSNN